jgi:hypothetical protein
MARSVKTTPKRVRPQDKEPKSNTSQFSEKISSYFTIPSSKSTRRAYLLGVGSILALLLLSSIWYSMNSADRLEKYMEKKRESEKLKPGFGGLGGYPVQYGKIQPKQFLSKEQLAEMKASRPVEAGSPLNDLEVSTW